MRTDSTVRTGTVATEVLAALALQVWLSRRLARATRRASDLETADLAAPAAR